MAVLKTHKQILVKEANLPAPFLAHAANQASVTLSTPPCWPR